MPSKCETNCSDSKTKQLYEYSVVQYVPNIERGEFINIGLVMMCKRRRWLQVRFHIDCERLRALFGEVDCNILKAQISSFELIGKGDVANGGPIASFEAHERFRWLTAVRSASIQTSRPHAGLTDDLEMTFNSLFHSMVE